MSWTACLMCLKSQTAEWQTNSRDILLWKLSVSTLCLGFGLVKTHTLKWQNSLSTKGVCFFFLLRAPFPSSYSRICVKGSCTREVASNRTRSHFLSVSVCYLFRQTRSQQHSHTCDGQTVLNMSSSSDGGEDGSRSPDIKLSYPFGASQTTPDNRNLSRGAVSICIIKNVMKGRRLIYSTPIIFVNGNELFMSTLDDMEIHDPWITLKNETPPNTVTTGTWGRKWERRGKWAWGRSKRIAGGGCPVWDLFRIFWISFAWKVWFCPTRTCQEPS